MSISYTPHTTPVHHYDIIHAQISNTCIFLISSMQHRNIGVNISIKATAAITLYRHGDNIILINIIMDTFLYYRLSTHVLTIIGYRWHDDVCKVNIHNFV